MDASSSDPPPEFPTYFVPGNNGEQVESSNDTFWTLCPYCYYLYQYEGIYKDCCLICQNCSKPFHGVVVQPPPPGSLVEGKDQYVCGIEYLSLKYNVGSSLGDKKGNDVGDKDSSLGEKKGNNVGNMTNLENFIVISDDDDCGIGGKQECKNEGNCNVETQGETGSVSALQRNNLATQGKEECKNEGNCNVETQGETGSVSVLQRNNLATQGKDGERKEKKRKVHQKTVARNRSKKMGKGITGAGVELSGNADSELREEVGESQPENTGRNGNQEQEEVFSEGDLDLEFFIGEDDIYIVLKDL